MCVQTYGIYNIKVESKLLCRIKFIYATNYVSLLDFL